MHVESIEDSSIATIFMIMRDEAPSFRVSARSRRVFFHILFHPSAFCVFVVQKPRSDRYIYAHFTFWSSLPLRLAESAPAAGLPFIALCWFPV